MHRFTSVRFVLLGAVLACLAATACNEPNAYKAPPPPKVVVAHAKVAPVTDYLELNGKVQSSESVDLTARVQGYLQSLHFTDGAMVKKGQLLFVIEPEPFEASLRQAEADVASAEATLARAKAEFARAQKLFTEKAGSESDVTRWRQERDSATAAVAVAKAKAEVARINLGYTRVTAPFDGRIGRRLVDVGNLVGPGEKAVLATLVRVAPIYAYVTMNERDLQRMFPSSAATGDKGKPAAATLPAMPLELGLSDEPGFPHVGKLDFVDNKVDQDTGTLLLRGVFENKDGRMLPGMFARVRLAVSRRDKALLVPEGAVGLGQGGHYVLVVNDKNVAEPHPVTLGPAQDGNYVIDSGISEADKIIISGLQMVRPGTPVTPVDEAQQGQQGQGGQQGQQTTGK